MPRYPGPEAIAPRAPSFIVVGDTQETAWIELGLERNHHLRPLLLAEIARRRPGAVLHLGDLVTWGASARHWERLDRDLAPVRDAGIPLLPVLGNHDRWPFANAGERHARARFPVLAGAPWYAFEHFGILFVALDSNVSALGKERVAAQARWLSDTVKGAEARPEITGVVAYWHHPVWTNSRFVGPSRFAREVLLDPLVRSRKLTLVLSGHCHGYERFEDFGVPLFVSGGGGGPRHPLETRPHKQRRADLFPGGRRRFLHFLELAWSREAFVVRVVRLRDDRSFDVAETVTVPFVTSAHFRSGDVHVG